jgi:hypothetical protein
MRVLCDAWDVISLVRHSGLSEVEGQNLRRCRCPFLLVILAQPVEVVLLAQPFEVVILAQPVEVVILAQPFEVVILAQPESPYWSLFLPLFLR